MPTDSHVCTVIFAARLQDASERYPICLEGKKQVPLWCLDMQPPYIDSRTRLIWERAEMDYAQPFSSKLSYRAKAGL